MSRPVLVIAPHPDDETLGCGGALLKFAAEGASLHWLLITSMHARHFSSEAMARQAAQIKAVEEAYPFASLDWLRLPTAALEQLPFNQLIASIRDVVSRIRPETVFVPNRSDVHSDHRVVSDVAQAVLKSFYMREFGVRRILACEVLSETEAAPAFAENAFLPNVYVDVSSTFRKKLEIMQMFQTEVHPEPLPRSIRAIEAQGRFRGASVGVAYAEAFMLVREIV